jgi:hypothetical protein
MGEELKKADLATGGDAMKARSLGSTELSKPTLAEIGISKDQSSRFQQLAGIPEETFDVVVETHRQADPTPPARRPGLP